MRSLDSRRTRLALDPTSPPSSFLLSPPIFPARERDVPRDACHRQSPTDPPPAPAGLHLRRVAQRARHPRSLYPDDEEKGRGTWRSPDQDIGRQSRCTSRSFLSPHCVQQCSPQEIAIRVFRTAHELAMHTVAIYSYEDRLSAHRQKVCRCYHCYDIAAQPRMYSPMRRTRSERA